MKKENIFLATLISVVAAIFFVLGNILLHEHKPKFYYVSSQFKEPCIMVSQDWETDEKILPNPLVDGNIGIQQLQIICDSLNKSLQKNLK